MRAMIVDDEAPARSELKYLLEESGRVDLIVEATSAREAVERLMEVRVDVMFLDISMPKTNGMQLAEALHKLKNPPQVVFVTAYSEYALDAFGVDATDYLMKPVETDRLAQALDKIVEHCDPYPDLRDEPLQLQISSLAYDDYIGRLGIGRITRGTLKAAQQVVVMKDEEESYNAKINQVFVYRGLQRMSVDEAECGDIVVVSGISDISIGETICDPAHPESLGNISIEEPTLSMNFMVNSSPFAGKVGKYVTSRHIKERLEKELEVNVGLVVEPTDSTDSFKVSGRGELHLSILIENMRREGYELAVSKPEVVTKRGDNGELLEPVEEVVVSVPDEYSGSVISKLNMRKGMMKQMMSEGNGYSKIEYSVPTRGLMGYRSEFINDTHGEGTMVRRF